MPFFGGDWRTSDVVCFQLSSDGTEVKVGICMVSFPVSEMLLFLAPVPVSNVENNSGTDSNWSVFFK